MAESHLGLTVTGERREGLVEPGFVSLPLGSPDRPPERLRRPGERHRPPNVSLPRGECGHAFEDLGDAPTVPEVRQDDQRLAEQRRCAGVVALLAGEGREIAQRPAPSPGVAVCTERLRSLLVQPAGFFEVSAIAGGVTQVVQRPPDAPPVLALAKQREGLFEQRPCQPVIPLRRDDVRGGC
jgi:hypothetical protein